MSRPEELCKPRTIKVAQKRGHATMGFDPAAEIAAVTAPQADRPSELQVHAGIPLAEDIERLQESVDAFSGVSSITENNAMPDSRIDRPGRRLPEITPKQLTDGAVASTRVDASHISPVPVRSPEKDLF